MWEKEAIMSRSEAWSVKALISIWGESKIQEELDGAIMNKTILCRAKIKHLKAQYRKVKDYNGKTGTGRISCKFYTKLDNILGYRLESVPNILLDAGTGSSTESQQIDNGPVVTEVDLNGKVMLCYT